MPEPSKREANKSRRRAAILAAAEELFSDKGFKETTMQNISERAGLSKGGVYLHFKSKEELYLTVCIKGIAGFGARLEAAVAGASGPDEAVKAVYLAYIRHSLAEPSVFRVLRDTFLERVRHNLSEKTIEQITGYIKAWLENESRLVRQGIEAGLFASDLDPYTFSLLAWRLSTGLIELALLQKPRVVDLADMDRVFEASIDILIKGIRP